MLRKRREPICARRRTGWHERETRHRQPTLHHVCNDLDQARPRRRVALAALGYGAIFVYANVINDAPDALDTRDLSDAIAVNAETEADVASDATPAQAEPGHDASPAAGFDGVWSPTLKGVILPVTAAVTAEASADSIGVLGSIPITFTDYGIDNPSNPAVSLEDDGVVEFVLVFGRSA